MEDQPQKTNQANQDAHFDKVSPLDICQLAQSFALQGQYNKAISIYESGLKIFPNEFTIKVGLNRTKDLYDQSIHGNPSSHAQENTDKSLPSILDENETTYHRLLGAGELLMKNKDLGQARQIFELCKVYNRKAFLPFFYLGKIAHLQGETYRAIEELKQAQNYNPFHTEMLDILGKSYFEVQQFESAMKAWIDGLIITAKSDPDKRREFKLCIEQAQMKLTGFTQRMRNEWVRRRQQSLKDNFDLLKTRNALPDEEEKWGNFLSAEDIKTQMDFEEDEEVELVSAKAPQQKDPPSIQSEPAVHVQSQESENMELMEKMRRHLVFKNLSVEDLGRIAKFTSEVRIRQFSFVYHEADPIFGLYFIDRGMVQINKNTSYGKIEFSTFMKGSFFGDDSLLNGTQRFTSAQCLEESDLLFLDKAGLAMIFAREKRLAIHFLWYLWKSLSFQVRDSQVKMNHFFQDRQKKSEDPKDKAFNIEIDHKLEVLQTKRLSEKELNLLSRMGIQEVYNTDETIFKEGDSGDRLYVVLEGTIDITKNTDQGSKVLSSLERGDFFGEMALAGNEHSRLTDAKAAQANSKLLIFTRQDLKEILALDAEAAYQFLTILCRILSQRLREMNEKLYQWKLMEGSF